MSPPARPGTPTQADRHVRLPGLFQRWEIDALLAECDVRIEETARGADGAPLFSIWTRAMDATRSERAAQQIAHLVAGRPERLAQRAEPMATGRPVLVEQMPLGELKARRRDEHLCFGCMHHRVCWSARAIDENLLVTITRCVGFRPLEDSDASELIPIEPIAAP